MIMNKQLLTGINEKILDNGLSMKEFLMLMFLKMSNDLLGVKEIYDADQNIIYMYNRSLDYLLDDFSENRIGTLACTEKGEFSDLPQFHCTTHISSRKEKVLDAREGFVMLAEIDHENINIEISALICSEDYSWVLCEIFSKLCGAVVEGKRVREAGNLEREYIRNYEKAQIHKFHEKGFVELFMECARKYADKCALKCMKKELTYKEVDDFSNCLAFEIDKSNKSTGKIIGIFMEKSVEFVVAMLAVMKSGNIFVPIDPYTLNPDDSDSFPVERLKFMIKDTKMDKVIINKHYSKVFEALSIRKKVIIYEDMPFSTNKYPARYYRVAYGIYTSGSTGHPKLTLVNQLSLTNLYHNLKAKCFNDEKSGRQKTVAVNAPFGFDASIQQLTFLLNGDRIVIIPKEVRNSVNQLIQYLFANNVNVFDCTPSQLSLLLKADFFKKCDNDLELLLVGGEAISKKMWTDLSRRKMPKIFNMYGPTECTVDTSIYQINGKNSVNIPVIGKAIDNCRMCICDEEKRSVPLGVIGEINILGQGVAAGYLGRVQLNKEKFFVNEMGERGYRSGDYGRRLLDGNIEFCGRRDGQVKVRSHRIELGEIVSVLDTYPEIYESRVKIVGDERIFIVAYIIMKRGKKVNEEKLCEYLKDYLPTYMLPHFYMQLDEWPLNSNQKIDERRLPKPDISGKRTSVLGEKEEKIARIMQKLLGIQNIGVKDNFMALGGDSLLVMSLLAEIFCEFGVEIDYADFFADPTIENICNKIGG